MFLLLIQSEAAKQRLQLSEVGGGVAVQETPFLLWPVHPLTSRFLDESSDSRFLALQYPLRDWVQVSIIDAQQRLPLPPMPQKGYDGIPL